MRSKVALVCALAIAAACGDAFTPDAVPSPDAASAQAISMTTIAVEWSTIPGSTIAGYRIERRENLEGAFHTVAEGTLPIPYFDTDLTPDTYYGYRVKTLTKLGEVSRPSVVAGARTPPPPGIVVETHTLGRGIDTDGYTSVVRGPADSQWASIGPSDSRRFSPLVPGAYSVDLQGIAGNCAVEGATTQGASVTDQGLNTVAVVRYEVRCRDPRLGRIKVTLNTSGDSLDANGYVVRLTGIADSATLPDSLRVVSRQQRFPAGGGAYAFDDLLPGDYELQLDDVAANCSVVGTLRREVYVSALGDVAVGYAVDCPSATPNTGGRPFILRNQLSPDPVAPGAKTTLAMTIDVSAVAGQSVSAAQGELRYDQTVLRFDSAKGGALDQFTVNGGTPGLVVWLGLTTGAPRTGVVAAGQIHFTAVGAVGRTSATRTANLLIVAGDGSTQIDTLVRVVEDTVTVGGGGGTNQAPSAHANGPYSGTANAPIRLSAAGSADPDGAIASYTWAFGDGGTGSGPSVTHTYTAAGTYTATLTVTDNLGATGSAQATVTVATGGGGGGGNQPPVAEANGPYSATASTPGTLSATGSSDPDGTIASYAWAFGDGGSATGAIVTHTYAVPGAYTATLTVTDNLGASASDQASVTVSAGGGAATPFTWAGTFGAVNAADSVVVLTVSLDLTTDIPETPSAEALATFAVDSLKWNATVLKYWAFNWGPGGSGSVQTTNALQGKLIFSSFTLPTSANSGLITVATIRFKVIGASGASTTTATAVGALIGTPVAGGYNYRSKTAIVEGTFIAP